MRELSISWLGKNNFPYQSKSEACRNLEELLEQLKHKGVETNQVVNLREVKKNEVIPPLNKPTTGT